MIENRGLGKRRKHTFRWLKCEVFTTLFLHLWILMWTAHCTLFQRGIFLNIYLDIMMECMCLYELKMKQSVCNYWINSKLKKWKRKQKTVRKLGGTHEDLACKPYVLWAFFSLNYSILLYSSVLFYSFSSI